MFDMRETTAIFSKSNKYYTSVRVALPLDWVKWLGITKEDRLIAICLDDDKIIIKKQKPGSLLTMDIWKRKRNTR